MRKLSLPTLRSLTLSVAALIMGTPLVAIESFYNLTITNNFGTGEYYGATPADSDIWILSNFKFDYKSGGNFVTGNATAGSFGPAVRLSDIQDGSVQLYSQDSGTRMHAVLSQGATAPTESDLGTKPNNYFEWSFAGSNPGTLDLSWIDSFDYLSKLTVDAKGTSGLAPTTVKYGAGSTTSTKTLGDQLQSYVDRAGGNYTWLGTTGGYSENINYTGATNATRWITKNSGTVGTINAQNIGSFTNAIDKAITSASSKPAWVSGTPATGPNWTDKGFRISGLQGVDPLDGSSLGGGDVSNMWSAYVSFEENAGEYTMNLTEFTIYGLKGGAAPSSGKYEELWTAGATVYSATQAEGLLDAIWTSSQNSLTTTPTWATNMGANAENFWYAIYNAIASGAIYDPNYVNDVALPVWAGYVPYIDGQNDYNFEILTQGAAVSGGLDGFLNGTDLVALMQSEDLAGDLVNPYFLELLALMEQTPSYLYPSQDFWSAISAGSDTFIGLQPGPLNSDAVFGAATFEWELGSGVAVPEPKAILFIGVIGLAVAGIKSRRPRRN